jgi:hypothetical protein
MEHFDRWIMTGWHGEQWDFQNSEKTMEHFDRWIMTGWHGEQWDFQNNEKTMEYSYHWIVTGWHYRVYKKTQPRNFLRNPLCNS